MPLRPPAGFISANFDPLRNPDAPTGVTASAGDAQASVSFTAPANVGGSAISAYYAVSNPGQITASGASSPVTVTGLTNGTAYTFQVWALNTFGPGAFSAASGSVTPAAARGVFGGGGVTIDYVTIATTGNATNFGTLFIPKKNTVIELNKQTLPFYKRLICVYEKNKLEIINDDIFINEEKTSTYKVKMNYYFVMGDNRDNSMDSRYWGFVPENHLIGKASFVLFSTDKKNSSIRWERMFKSVR